MSSDNNSFYARSLSWVRRHKIAAGIIGFFVLILAAGFFTTLTSSLGTSSSSFGVANPVSEMGSPQRSAGDFSDPVANDGGEADIPGVEIKKGNLSVDSEDAAADEQVVRSVTADYQGYVEESSQTETNTNRNIHLTTRVPSESFSSYTQNLRDQLEVEDYRLRNYRINIEEQTTELDIIADTSSMYAAMKTEAQSMPLDAERIELTMEITERQLDLKERENRLQQGVDRVNRQGEMATLQVTLHERLSAEIWPEDLGNEFRDSLRETIQEVIEIAIAIVTTSLVVFMTALQWAIWLMIILVVLWFAYRILRYLKNRRGN